MTASNKANRVERIQLLLNLPRGAKSRKNILKTLLFQPRNCNRIAEEVNLDWWTVQKHLQILIHENAIKTLDFGRRKFYILTLEGREALEKIEK